MHILAFVSAVRGSGASTLAAHVAKAAAGAGGGPAALVVLGSGHGEAAADETGFRIVAAACAEARAVFARLRSEGFACAVVDVASADVAAIGDAAFDADLIAIPVLASVRHGAEIEAALAAVRALGKPFVFVPNRIGVKGLSAPAVMALTQHGQVCPIPVPKLDAPADEIGGLMARLWGFFRQQMERQARVGERAAPRTAAAAQRRKHWRWPAKWQVKVQCRDETAIGRVQNISGGGAMLLTRLPIATGDAVFLEIPPLGTYEAGVVHKQGDSHGLAFAMDDAEQDALAERLDAMFTGREGPSGQGASGAPPAARSAAAPRETAALRSVAVAAEDLEAGGGAADRPSHAGDTGAAGDTGDAAPEGATVITIANPKGGSGKSTIAMHLVVALLRAGRRVASADLDAGQWTLTRYLENRREFAAAQGLELPVPVDHVAAGADDDAGIGSALRRLATAADVVVVDTAGRASAVSHAGHAAADVLITPINDSFVDLDVLASLDPATLAFRAPSAYGAFVAELQDERAAAGRAALEWIVLRSRLTNLDARNKRDMAGALDALAERCGFRIGPGFGERTIYRELFLHGLTLSDLKTVGTRFSISHVAARQELRALLACLFAPAAARPAAVPSDSGDLGAQRLGRLPQAAFS